VCILNNLLILDKWTFLTVITGDILGANALLIAIALALVNASLCSFFLDIAI